MQFQEYTSRAEMIAAHKTRMMRLGLVDPTTMASKRIAALRAEGERRERIERQRTERLQRKICKWFDDAWKLVDRIQLDHMQLEPDVGIRQIRIADIIAAGCIHFRISKSELLAQRRTAEVVFARQVVMYLAKTLTLRSLPEIGRRFGGRDHTTVLHAVRKFQALIKTDPYVAAHIEAIERELGIYQTRDERAAA